MTDEISSGDHLPPITPGEHKMYEQEYKHGAKLFQKALQQYVKSDNPYQQHEFEEVMEKALQVLNETASALNQGALLKQNMKIEQDYNKFTAKPEDPETYNQLNRDLDKAKNSIG